MAVKKEKRGRLGFALYMAAVFFLILCIVPQGVYATQTVGLTGYFASLTKAGSLASAQVWLGQNVFPWSEYFNALAKTLTGPTAITVGIITLAITSFLLMTGAGGQAMQKYIIVIFAVSTMLFLPTFIGWMQFAAGGATIDDVTGIVHTVSGTIP